MIDEQPNHDELAAELAQLEHVERELSDERAHLHGRMDVGLPEISRSERQALADRLSLHRRIERQLSDQRLTLHQRIDLLRAQLSDSAG